jgi:hypothetical protein
MARASAQNAWEPACGHAQDRDLNAALKREESSDSPQRGDALALAA